ncbi:lipid-A-disaccharide synthase [Aminivibrio sp.]
MIFFSCGEISGDGYASGLLAALRSLGYEGEIAGMIGPRTAAGGGTPLWDSGALSIMGISGALGALPRLLKLKREMTEDILRRNPEALVVFDSPDFHLPLVSALRKKEWRGRIIYAVPPTVWAWRPWRCAPLAREVDLCLPLFRFEHEFLAERGVPSLWRGHPLVDEFLSLPRKTPPSPKQIALLPGSRRSEISRLLPPLTECADLLEKRGYRPVFSIAPGLPADLGDHLRESLRGREYDEREGRVLMADSAAVAGASGTAAVEAMMAGRFMAVLYKMDLLSFLVWHVFVSTPFISLPNLLVKREIYPELLQRNATGEKAFRALTGYLEDDHVRAVADEKIAEAREAMGPPGAFSFWARSVLDLLPPPARAS